MRVSGVVWLAQVCNAMAEGEQALPLGWPAHGSWRRQGGEAQGDPAVDPASLRVSECHVEAPGAPARAAGDSLGGLGRGAAWVRAVASLQLGHACECFQSSQQPSSCRPLRTRRPAGCWSSPARAARTRRRAGAPAEQCAAAGGRALLPALPPLLPAATATARFSLASADGT